MYIEYLSEENSNSPCMTIYDSSLIFFFLISNSLTSVAFVFWGPGRMFVVCYVSQAGVELTMIDLPIAVFV